MGALILVSPWPYGMATWGAMVWLAPIVAVITLCAVVVAIKNGISVGNPLAWSLAGLVALALFQTVTIPESAWESISAGADFESSVQAVVSEFVKAEVLPTDGAKAPRTLSIHPSQTRASAAILACALALLVSATVLFRTTKSSVFLLIILAATGIANVSIGIYQAIVPSGWTLLSNMSASSFSTFVSRNSAPQFIICSFGATAALILMVISTRKTQADKRYQISYPSVNPLARIRRRFEDFLSDIEPASMILLTTLILLSAGILVANSRGGTLACTVAAVLSLVVFALGKQLSSGGALVTIALLLCSAGFLSLFDLDAAIGERLESVSEEAYQRDNVRLELWQMAAAQPSAWKFGSGLGTFHFAILPAYTRSHSTWFYHAENLYIESLSNFGPFGVVTVLVALAWLLWSLLTQKTTSAIANANRFACLISVLAISLHSLVDFSLVLPAVFIPLVSLAGAFLGTRNLTEKTRRKRRSSSHRHSSDVNTSDAGASQRGAGEKASVKQKGDGPDATHRNGVRNKRSASRSSPSTIPNFLTIALILPFAGVAIVRGQPAVRAYAAAEGVEGKWLEEQVARIDAEESGEWNSGSFLPRSVEAVISSYSGGRFEQFPEMRIQLGRILQSEAGQTIRLSETWPEDVGDSSRDAMSRLEFATAAFSAAGSNLEQLAPLKGHIEGVQGVSPLLQASMAQLQHAIDECPMDWRASWGQLRSDAGVLSAGERAENYARLFVLCKHNQAVRQSVGTHAILSGEIRLGLEIWRQLLRESNLSRRRVIGLLDLGVSPEELARILPDAVLTRLAIIENLARRERVDEARVLIDATDIEAGFSVAQVASQWKLLAWAAAFTGASELQARALREATLDDTMNAQLYFELATVLQDLGRLSEALDEIGRAVNISDSDPRYLDLQDEIRDLLTK